MKIAGFKFDPHLWPDIFDAIPGLLCLIDADYRILKVNSAMASRLGYAPRDLLGRYCYQVVHGLDHPPDFCPHTKTMNSGKMQHAEVFEDRLNGTFDVSTTPVYDSHGKFAVSVHLARDITESRKAREERIAREAAERASRLKSEFVAGMSHEIRTSLTVIIGFAQIMEKDPALTRTQTRDVQMILRSAKHLLQLINEILDISKIEAGKIILRPVDFNLPDLLKELTGLFKIKAGSKGLELILEMDRDLPGNVRADSHKLRQIIINLLDNAIKFTASGRVVLRAGAERAAENGKNDHAHLNIQVEDTGPGISDPDLNSLFIPFHQTAGTGEQQGTGLGLAISRGYTDLMGGDLSVSTLKDRGSCFQLQIPVGIVQEKMEPGEKKPGIARLEPGSGPWRVLIVDDEPDNMALLRALLKPVGFQVREAVNGLEAVKIFKEWSPHAVLMDLRMPVMDGLEAARHIRDCAAGRDVFVIAFTAGVFNNIRENHKKTGIDAYFHKPFQKDELFRLLEMGLGLKYEYKT